MQDYLHSKVWWQIALIYAVIAMLFGASTLIQQQVSAVNLPNAQPIKLATVVDAPTRVIIPSADVDVVVQPGGYDREAMRWFESETSALFATSTQVADIAHNTTLIYAHDRPGLFTGIQNLKSGDEILVYTSKTMQVYAVSEEGGRVVLPTDVSVLETLGKTIPQIILLTCEGLMSDKRFVVQAVMSQERAL